MAEKWLADDYLKTIIDASDLLELTSPAITAVGLAGFHNVVWPFPVNIYTVSTPYVVKRHNNEVTMPVSTCLRAPPRGDRGARQGPLTFLPLQKLRQGEGKSWRVSEFMLGTHSKTLF